MKFFWLFSISAVGTICAAFIMWWFSLGYYQPAEHWLRDVYVAKEYRAEQIDKPKIIIVSGSNSLFGLDSQLLEQVTGKPVVNLAGHAGLPLDFLLSTALTHTRQGDQIVMPLEFGYYNESGVLNDWQVSNLESWGHKYIKSSFTNLITYFRYASLINAAERLWHRKPIPGEGQHLILETVNYNSKHIIVDWVGYSFKSMNASGDILVESTGKTFNDDASYIGGEVNEYALNLLKSYSKKIEQKGASLILTWPTTIKNPRFDLSTESDFQRVENIKYKLLAHGLVVMCSPLQFQFERSNFLDTSYHLNYEGAVQRTVNLGECLNGRIGEFSAKNIYAEREVLAREVRSADAQQKALLEKKIHDDQQAREQAARLAEAEKMISLVLSHLESIVNALNEFYKANNAYPISDKWDGIYSSYGTSSPAWIKGLAPKYISQLPRDPRMSDKGYEQYIYNSDGKNFKLISTGRPDCELFRKKRPSVVDPARDCQAIGFWTEDAKNW